MKKRTLSLLLIALFSLVAAASASAADIAVIVNKANGNDVNRGMVEKIYSGDMVAWPAGGAVAAFDLPEDSADRAAFSQSLLGKSTSNLKALWAAKLFSGRATPPKVQGSDADVRRAVAANKNAIGYINAAYLDDTVKSVLTLR